QQRQHLETFVVRAEAARKECDGVRFLEEEQLAVEKVVEADELRIAENHLVCLLFERQLDVDAEAALAAGAALTRFHDAPAGAGYDHEPGSGDGAGEVLGGGEDRVVALCARRAERRDLAGVAVGREQREGVAHLVQRAGDDLEIAYVDAVLVHGTDRRGDLFNQSLRARAGTPGLAGGLSRLWG